MTTSGEEDGERAELLKARDALRHQLELLRTPAHSRGNRELPAKLYAKLKEIEALLAADEPDADPTIPPASP